MLLHSRVRTYSVRPIGPEKEGVGMDSGYRFGRSWPMNRRSSFLFCILVLGTNHAREHGQPPPVILDMRAENRVVYVADTADVSKLATNAGSTTPISLRTFANF